MKVSIVIPVYNVALYLTRCLDSVGRQTFRDFEVVAVNDGSTDESGKVLDAYAASFPLKRIHQANGGASKARNSGFAATTGERVMFLDADDVIHPRLLEWTQAALDESGADYAVFDHRKASPAKLDRASDDWPASAEVPGYEMLAVPAFDWFVRGRRLPAPWQFLVRRADLPPAPFPVDIAIYEDVPFTLGLVARPLRGVWVRKALYGYSVMEKSQSHNSPLEKRMSGIEAGMRLLRSQMDDRQWRLHARNNCAPWILDLWREIRALSAADARCRFHRRLCELVDRLRKDGLIRWRDFKLSRRLRLMTFLARCRREAK